MTGAKKRYKNLENIRFNRLVAIRIVGKNKHNVMLWECLCNCGKTIITQSASLLSGNTKSCGCLNKEKKVNHSYPKESKNVHKIWNNMKTRCYNKNNHGYKNYGGRGITMCDTWLNSFMAFYEDMGSRPFKNAQIDRIDNNKGYYKENCRWVTPRENHRNMRSNVMITYEGETMCIEDWSEKTGLSRGAIQHRLNKGWSTQEALLTPPLDTKFNLYQYRDQSPTKQAVGSD